MDEQERKGLSADCKLNGMLVMAILMKPGNEHPCDGCNIDRNICRGFPKRSRSERGRIL